MVEKQVRSLPEGFSIFMDALRASMALLVLFCHMNKPRVVEDLISGFRFQHDAVIVFFVLSGYLIMYAAEQRDKTAKRYFISRASRILSVSVPAVFFAVAAQLLGVFLYDDWPAIDNSYLFAWINSSLLFSNQIWNANYQIYILATYWSLAFEVWFYIIFGVYMFASGRKKLFLLAGLVLFVGPKILILMPIWLSGCWVYRLHGDIKISRHTSLLIFFGSLALYAFAKLTIGRDPYFDYPGMGSFLTIPLWVNFGVRMDFAISFVWDYFVGVLVSLLVFSSYYLFKDVDMPKIVSRPARYFAKISFSVYLYQIPILWYLGKIDQHGVPGIIFYPLKFALAVLACSVLYSFTEKQKPLLSSVLKKMLMSTPSTSKEINCAKS